MTRFRLSAVAVLFGLAGLLGTAGVLGTAGCASQPGQIAGTAAAQSPAQRPVGTVPPGSSGPAVPPPDPKPARRAPCPYLADEFVEQTNGQRVGRTAVSADASHPACFFYRDDGAEQLRVQVLVGADPAVAKALVGRAAPVATADPAQLPGGWDGGKQPTESGAVFAVHKAGSAVVVAGNQQQTIKVSRIAQQVIVALGL